MARGGENQGDSWFTEWVDRMKRHPVGVGLSLLVGLLGVVALVVGLTVDVGSLVGPSRPVVATFVETPIDERAVELDALASLDLDITPDFFEQNIGVPKVSVDPCASMTCEGIPPDTLRLVIHEGEYATVRAMFDRDRLAFYAVTATVDDLLLDMKWLGHELGTLGQVSFADALAVTPVPEPTEAEIRKLARSLAYAETLAAGPKSDYRGLYLAYAPYGVQGGGVGFDVEAADALSSSTVLDPEVLREFRESSTPNTFGEFRDDGPVAAMIKADLISMLYMGTDSF